MKPDPVRIMPTRDLTFHMTNMTWLTSAWDIRSVYFNSVTNQKAVIKKLACDWSIDFRHRLSHPMVVIITTTIPKRKPTLVTTTALLNVIGIQLHLELSALRKTDFPFMARGNISPLLKEKFTTMSHHALTVL